jgi:hypothetical protein
MVLILYRNCIIIIVKITRRAIFLETLIAAQLVRDYLYVSGNPDFHKLVQKSVPLCQMNTVRTVTFSLILLLKIMFNRYRVLVGKPEGRIPLGRPRRRWEDNIKMDLQEVGVSYGDWMELAQDRYGWRALVGTVWNLRVPKMRGVS